jgi:serine/threonine protein kinase
VIEERLSQGGMAEIFLARTDATGISKRVVIKSLLPRFRDDEVLRAMLINEARIVAGLCHPNLVRVEDLVELDGRPFIVMEYLRGRNLRQIFGRVCELGRRLPPGLACYVVARVLAGLGHAHDLEDEQGRPVGLVHRDLSMTNIMVTWSGGVKVIDFGIAKETMVMTDLTRPGELKGKSAYMSPEQVRCEPLDRRSDLFSAGIVLWELLTLSRLFRRSSDIDTLMAVCTADVPDPSAWVPGLPGRLDQICRKALARDRDHRYQTAEAMHADLQELIDEQRWKHGPAVVRRLLSSLFSLAPDAATSAYASHHARRSSF